MIDRVTDWPTRLDEFLAARAAMPFAWGSNDCITFAVAAVLAITGTDMMPRLPGRGRYKSERGAYGTLQRLMLGNNRTVADAAAWQMAKHDVQQVRPAFAQRGDVGLGASERGDTLVVRTASHWVGPGLTGMQTMPDASVYRAWAIGRTP